MDRKIPQEVLRKEKKKRWIKIGSIVAAVAVVFWISLSFLQTSVKRADITIGTVDKGSINVSVNGSGKVVPAIEEVITTPISSRILEVYKRAGDSVDINTPILKLDLESTKTEYNKMLDQLEMKRYEIEQLRARTHSSLSDLEMKVKVGQMKVNRKEVELRNEKYLDSIGAGTEDKVREVELSYNVSKLEQEQLEEQLKNYRSIGDAELKVKILDMKIFEKSLNEMKRLLEDAQIRSPRKAILTFVNNQVGAQVPAGTQVAIVSDLSHFKIDAEISDTYADRFSAGSEAIVKIGKEQLPGFVSSVTPMSKNGVIYFTVQLEKDDHERLRSGLKTDVHILTSVKEEVMRLPNASYYSGPGEYDLFVVQGDELVKRKVRLGDSNFDYVEVREGLKEGDQVVTTDMKEFRNKKKLALK